MNDKLLNYEEVEREAILKIERDYPDESAAEKCNLVRAEMLIRYYAAGQLEHLLVRLAV